MDWLTSTCLVVQLVVPEERRRCRCVVMGRRDLVDLDIVLIWCALVGLLTLFKLHEGAGMCSYSCRCRFGDEQRSEVGNKGKTVRYQERMEC